MLRILIIISLMIVSCSPSRRASWHLKRAVQLDQRLLVPKNDTIRIIDTVTIYIDKPILIPSGVDTIFKDSIRTERSIVKIYKINDTCIAELNELPFEYRYKDTLNYIDTCVTSISNTEISTNNVDYVKTRYVFIAFIAGLLLGIYIKVR